MQVFEIIIAESAISLNGGAFAADNQLTYWIPDEAIDILDPILDPYNQDPRWFFDGLNFGRPPAPWAFACLDREHLIAGHIVTTRPTNAGVSFAPYKQVPIPRPNNYVPGVGILVFASKNGIEQSSTKSPLFKNAWCALQNCSIEKRWLVILDPPDQEWLNEVSLIDRDLWNTYINTK